jgi:hypothetical protein
VTACCIGERSYSALACCPSSLCGSQLKLSAVSLAIRRTSASSRSPTYGCNQRSVPTIVAELLCMLTLGRNVASADDVARDDDGSNAEKGECGMAAPTRNRMPDRSVCRWSQVVRRP